MSDPNHKPRPQRSREERRATGPKSIARLRRKQARQAIREQWQRMTPEEQVQKLMADTAMFLR